MFKDRRVLLEKSIAEQTKKCGELYLRIVKGECDATDEKIYDVMKEKLTDLLTDLMIVNQMIQDGHE